MLRKFLLAGAFCAMTAITANTAQAGPGKVVVAGDEWALTNSGLATDTDATKHGDVKFATNVAAYFGLGSGSNTLFLDPTTSGTKIFGSDFANLIGGTVTSSNLWNNSAFTGYNAVFVSGNVTGNQAGLDSALSNFVNAGGKVYIAGGTAQFYATATPGSGTYNAAGIPANEAAAWNPFLNQYDLGLDSSNLGGPFGYNGLNGVQSPLKGVPSTGAGVDELYVQYGQQAQSVSTTGGAHMSLVNGSGYGLVAESAIPEPAFYQMSALLLGGGLMGLRLRKKQKAA